jgi:AraC family transcriptional regulator
VDDLLRSHPEASHSIASLATVAGMSPFHFMRSFKKRYGVSPHAYQLNLRLERACLLMRSPELSLTAVALEVGFASSGRFTEAFKRRFGITPSVWRSRL